MIISRRAWVLVYDAPSRSQDRFSVERIGLNDQDVLDYLDRRCRSIPASYEFDLYLIYHWKGGCEITLEPSTLGAIARLGGSLCIDFSQED